MFKGHFLTFSMQVSRNAFEGPQRLKETTFLAFLPLTQLAKHQMKIWFSRQSDASISRPPITT